MRDAAGLAGSPARSGAVAAAGATETHRGTTHPVDIGGVVVGGGAPVVVQSMTSTDTAERIGVNGGSLDQDLLVAKMEENTERDLGKTSEEIVGECMVLSARRSWPSNAV